MAIQQELVTPSVVRRLLPDPVAFFLLASIVVSFLAGSAAPTPLYSVYQGEWGFSPITTTVVFGVYAVAVLVSLLVTGRLSDHVGRRPVLLVAIAFQALSMIAFMSAHGVPELLAARIVQGLSTGAAVAAVGAGLLDLDRTRGTIANSVAPMLGTATGGLGSGLLVQFLPIPTHLVYALLLVVFVLQGVGVGFMRESVTPMAGAVASLRPQFGVPAAARGPLLAAVPVLVAAWALAGFYGSVGPALLHAMVGSSSLLLGGLGLFVLAGSGALTVLLTHSRPAAEVMRLGVAGLFFGVGLSLAAIALGSASVLFVGMVVAGIGFGGGFQGAVRTVVPLAAAHQRAGLLSIVYVVSYLAMGLPAIVAGVLVVDSGGVITTAKEYAVAVMLLAAVSGLSTVRRQPATRGCTA